MTLTVTVTATVTQDGMRSTTANVDERASRSVPHNIGEGVGKRGKARAASYEIALGEAKELIVALDCVEIDPLADTAEIVAAQDLADRVSAMLTKLIRSV